MTIAEWVKSVYDAKREFHLLAGRDAPTPPNGPLKDESDIKKLESEFGHPLPADYREFLKTSNGWPGFSGDNGLYSTDEMLRDQRIRTDIANKKAIIKVDGEDPEAAAGLFIYGSIYTRKSMMFIPQKRSKAAKLVYWDIGREDEYESFTAYLENTLKTYRSMAAQERKTRGKPAKTQARSKARL